jgi:hypothetical protein
VDAVLTPSGRTYREMAIANGVAADHPVLERCRDQVSERRRQREAEALRRRKRRETNA